MKRRNLEILKPHRLINKSLDFFLMMTKINQNNRFNAEEALSHSWLQQNLEEEYNP